MIDRLRENDSFVCQLRDAIGEGQAGLRYVPMLVKRVITEKRWQKRVIATGKEPDFARFEEFVAAEPLEGLGATMDMLKRICKDDKDALDAIDGVVQRKPGRPKENLDNIQGFPSGTSEQAAIRRLRKDRPDLLERVKQGDLSAHAAMVEAGFRPRSITIPDDPEQAGRRLKRHFTGDRLQALIRELQQ